MTHTKQLLLSLCSALMLLLTVPAEAQLVGYINTDDFKTKVFDYTKNKEWKYAGKKPCVIDFYTTWCGPCKRLAPIMEELAETYKNQVIFYKADTEKERELAYVFQISSIPQVLYVPAKGQPILLKGLYPKETIIQIIDEQLLGKKPAADNTQSPTQTP